MGALASHAQQRRRGRARGRAAAAAPSSCTASATASRRQGEGVAEGAFFAPTLLLCRDPLQHDAVHDVEAFGPVSTLMAYDGHRRGAGAGRTRQRQPGRHAGHDATRPLRRARPAWPRHARPPAGARPRGGGRIHRPRLAAAVPQARRPGPRRRRRRARRPARRQALPAARRGAGIADHAGGGDRRARARREACANPMCTRSAATSRTCRSATRCSRTAAPSAKPTSSPSAASRATTSTCTSTRSRPRRRPFGKRIAHGYFVLSAAAGPVRFPGAGPGAGQLRARHAALRQAGGHRRHDPGAPDLQAQDRPQQQGRERPGQGVVAWDVEVTNQDGELVASYDILTLVAKRGD